MDKLYRLHSGLYLLAVVIALLALGNPVYAGVVKPSPSPNTHTLPTVAWTSPVNLQTFDTGTTSINLLVSAMAHDGARISKVMFYNGDTYLGTSRTSPYQITIPVTTGTYSFLQAVAYDSFGTSTTSVPISVTVGFPTPTFPHRLPTVAWISPANGQTFTGVSSINLSVDVTAYDGASITKVMFGNGANFIGTSTTSPYQVSMPVTTGTYDLIQAVAYDSLGTSTTSTAITVNVVNNGLPIVRIISNPAGGIVPASVDLDGSSSSSINGSIVSYSWDLGDGNMATTPTVSHVYTTSGNFIVRLTVTDSTGAQATNTATIVVSPPGHILPSVTWISPANGQTFTGVKNITLSVNAMAHDGATITKVMFYNGGTFIGTSTSSPYQVTMKVLKGTYSLLQAVAYDSFGTRTTVGVISITIN